MEKEIVLIPSAASGHVAPMVELGKALTRQYNYISVTIFIMDLPFQTNLNSYTQDLASNQHLPRMRFVHLTLDEPALEYLRSKPMAHSFIELAILNKTRVKEFYDSESATRIAAFVVDLFCTPFADVAAEFAVPSYVFFTANACFLNLMFYLQELHDYENQDFTEFKGLNLELPVPGFVNSLPVKVLPNMTYDKEIWGPLIFVDIPRELRKTKGILVNTYTKLESHAIKCLTENGKLPPIYPVGPILDVKAEGGKDKNDLGKYEAIMMWLDDQPPTSVVFLCFGSLGTFQADQVTEIAYALEQSGHRFMWSLRRPPTQDEMVYPSEYESFDGVLPEGFLDRTKEVGKVIGWAPQVAVLAHPAVGGFVSHCGWNSTIESLWFGVPMATWPLYAEQQMNAFMMVKELGLAVEIKLDNQKNDNPILVTKEEIKRSIKQLMEGSEGIEIKKKVQAIKEECRMAVVEGGSSYVAMGHFIDDVLNNS